MPEESNHIGKKAWKKLSNRQRRAIINNRSQARALMAGYQKDKELLDKRRRGIQS